LYDIILYNMLERLKEKFQGDKPAANPPACADEVILPEPSTEPVEKLTEKPFTYHQTKDIIETARLKYGEETGNNDLPLVSFSREKNSSNIKFDVAGKVDMFPLLIEITKTVGDLELSSYATFSDHIHLYKKNGLKIWLRMPKSYLPGSIEFSKDNDLEVQEIEALINAYKLANPFSEKKSDPKKVLESLGATIFNPEDAPDWDYLAGYESIKEQVKETVVLTLKHPEIYEQIAKKTRRIYESNRPKAVLFEGPPGTGKTTMARIIAGQVDAPLIYVPIESIMSKWYGESENNLATIFNECKSLGNALLFLDEIDSLATTRDGDIHEETRRVLSVLLRNIDGFNPNEKTILIGATNRKKDLDPALLSRFDTNIEFPLPDTKERQVIFGNYATHLSEEGLVMLAQEAEGLSGRDIKNLCERTERSWASKLISDEASVTNAPSLNNYLAWIKKS